MLMRHLRELEAHGVIARKVYVQVPPKTEYSLTDMGHSLEPILWAMHDWAEEHMINRKSSVCFRPACVNLDF